MGMRPALLSVCALVLLGGAAAYAAEMPAEFQKLLEKQAKEQMNGGRAASPGQNQMRLGTDAEAAKRDVGVTFYTPELSEFNDRTCADGPCRNSIPGIAHRSWPLNSCVAVCSLKSLKCALAIVMDRGPAEWLRSRTIDANPALSRLIQVNGLTPATYKLVSIEGDCPAGALEGNANPVTGFDPYNPAAAPAARPAANTGISLPPYTAGSASVSAPLSGSSYIQSSLNSPVSGTAGLAGSSSADASLSSSSQASGTAVRSAPEHAAALFTQPSSVPRGDPVVVSWTSVGMSAAQPCLLLEGTTTLARKNEGTLVFKTADSARGTLVFSLACTPLSGSPIRLTRSLRI